MKSATKKGSAGNSFNLKCFAQFRQELKYPLYFLTVLSDRDCTKNDGRSLANFSSSGWWTEILSMYLDLMRPKQMKKHSVHVNVLVGWKWILQFT